ncbi:EI24 domain-containing protein [Roseovarius aestuariivivens]|uniref:EI24 domain-containing protein n=1 Tax=Roseovarius aestuariivivens TaxID=1888910 RepID=UPI0010808749|nr:EI24 domain-containing protein [Roseovarius aestuariivivens]
MIFGSFFQALGQIGDPRFRRVLLLGIGLTLALLIAATVGVLIFIQWISGDTTTVWLIGEVNWIDDLLSFAGLGVMILLSIVLMVPVASAITSMFLDEVAQAVEDRHYPDLPPADPQPMGEAFKDTVNFLGVIVAANIVALFFYALFAPMAPFIFWGLNGYLLGMEYFQLAAMRRIGRKNAKTMRKANRGLIWAAGALMAIPLTVPVLNLVIPILGAATFTHIFHKVNARQAG